MAKKKGNKKQAAKTPTDTDPQRGADLAEQALDPNKQEDVEAAIRELTPEQAAMFVEMLEKSLKKRRLQLLGYISALVALLAGTVFSLYIYGTREPGEFVGWVFLVPFLCAGALLMFFGRAAKNVK